MKKQTLKNSLLQKKRISKLQQARIVGGYDGDDKTRATKNEKCQIA